MNFTLRGRTCQIRVGDLVALKASSGPARIRGQVLTVQHEEKRFGDSTIHKTHLTLDQVPGTFVVTSRGGVWEVTEIHRPAIPAVARVIEVTMQDRPSLYFARSGEGRLWHSFDEEHTRDRSVWESSDLAETYPDFRVVGVAE